MRRATAMILFAIWCGGVLLAFAFAGANGYAAFATTGRPTPLRPTAGLHHK
jgi:hypothetical protein